MLVSCSRRQDAAAVREIVDPLHLTERGFGLSEKLLRVFRAGFRFQGRARLLIRRWTEDLVQADQPHAGRGRLRLQVSREPGLRNQDDLR